MYTKDKSHRITLRLNEDQYNFVLENAETLGVSPSDFLRMVINASLSAARKLGDRIDKMAVITEGEGQGRENDKADKHDFV